MIVNLYQGNKGSNKVLSKVSTNNIEGIESKSYVKYRKNCNIFVVNFKTKSLSVFETSPLNFKTERLLSLFDFLFLFNIFNDALKVLEHISLYQYFVLR